MTAKQVGMILQGVGIMITALSFIIIIKLQPIPIATLVIGIVIYCGGHLVRRINY